MGKKRNGLPARIHIEGQGTYVPVVMKIQTKDEQGRPEDLTLVPDDRSVEIVGGEEFLIAYVLRKLVKRE